MVLVARLALARQSQRPAVSWRRASPCCRGLFAPKTLSTGAALTASRSLSDDGGRCRSTLGAIEQAEKHGDRLATVCGEGRHSYADLVGDSAALSVALRGLCPAADGSATPDLDGARVAFLCPPGAAFVTTLWAIWRAGGISVPLCTTHPADELRYVLEDSAAQVVVVHADFADALSPVTSELAAQLVSVDYHATLSAAAAHTSEQPVVEEGRQAHIVYTSGTTGRPKGVVHTHRAIRHQITDLVSAWAWVPSDRILHFLPLHHTHGIINKLACPLWVGATVEFIQPGYSAPAVWARLIAGVCPKSQTTAKPAKKEKQRGRRATPPPRRQKRMPPITVFMAVPTVYAQLVEVWEGWAGDGSHQSKEYEKEQRALARQACDGVRLMVCGSAALPLATLNCWRTISGHVSPAIYHSRKCDWD